MDPNIKTDTVGNVVANENDCIVSVRLSPATCRFFINLFNLNDEREEKRENARLVGEFLPCTCILLQAKENPV